MNDTKKDLPEGPIFVTEEMEEQWRKEGEDVDRMPHTFYPSDPTKRPASPKDGESLQEFLNRISQESEANGDKR